jgi:UDP-N-acetylglucosamine/UDP-N-acetylgalactosamine 4-epimerase
MKIKNSRVLVTGGAGFIGSNLCEDLLHNENDVICLDNFITGKRENIAEFNKNKYFTLIDADIRDEKAVMKAVDGVDIVLHQAALGSVPRSIENPAKTNDINISGFLTVLNQAKDAGIKRFVYASSSSVYGDNYELPKKEEKIGKPLSPYAITKFTNELYAKNFSDLFGIETIGLRYFNVFGKRQDPDGAYAAVIPKFISLLLNGESPIVNGDGEQTRDFTYIENVIQVNNLAATSKNSNALNEVYNVAYGEKITLNILVELLKDNLSNFKRGINEVPIKYGPNRVGDILESLASIEKAEKYLNYKPQFNVKRGLELAINWYVKNLG